MLPYYDTVRTLHSSTLYTYTYASWTIHVCINFTYFFRQETPSRSKFRTPWLMVEIRRNGLRTKVVPWVTRASTSYPVISFFGTMRIGGMFVSDLVEEMDLITRSKDCGGNWMDGSIAPALFKQKTSWESTHWVIRNSWSMMEWAYLVIETTFWVQIFEEFHVGFSSPEFHVGYLEVAPDFIGVHHDLHTSFWWEKMNVDLQWHRL